MPDPLTHTFGSVASALRPLGAPPIGSPADVRAHAARLRAVADGLSPAQALLARASELEGSEGPAANRSRAALRHERHMLEQRVHAIRELAARLDAQANALANEQGAWRRALRSRAAGLPGALVDAAVRSFGWRLP